MDEDAETLVVVDEEDEPVTEAPRERVHAEELRHRAVHVLLADGEGRLLLQKRSDEKRTYPNRWTSSASGHVEAGESLREAARREVVEELGVQSPPLSYLGWIYVEDLDVGEREFTHVFAGQHSGPFEPDATEVTTVEAFESHEVGDRLQIAPEVFAASFQEIWTALRGGGLENDPGTLKV